MRQEAQPFFDAALRSWRHAQSHRNYSDPDDVAQAYLSLDHMAEMLAKGALLERGNTILDANGRTIHLPEALARLGYTPHQTDVLILRDNRNGFQHAATYRTTVEVVDLADSVRRFAAALAAVDFPGEGQPFGSPPPGVRARPGTHAPASVLAALANLPGTPVDGDPRPQRDADFGGGVLTWAEQASPTNGSLVVKVRDQNGVRTLTEPGGFEYMPHTDGVSVVTNRQWGGVLLHDVRSGTTSILSDTGAPGAVSGEVVAVQGLAVSDGVAGGVWLLRLGTSKPRFPEQVSPGGDSPRLSGGQIVWQEFSATHEVRMRPVRGGAMATIATGSQPALDGHLLAWLDGSGALWARDLSAAAAPIRLADQAFGPDVLGDRIAYLEGSGRIYTLTVQRWPSGTVDLSVLNVDFPTGRGPTLTDDSVVWETGQSLGMGHLRELPL